MINPLDAAIVLAFLISALAGLWRGFLREALALAGWVAAAWVALTFTPALDARLAPYVSVPAARSVLAFVLLFVATLFTVTLMARALGALLRAVGLGGVDRAVGGLFGLARGVVVVVVMLVLGRMLGLDQAPWWQASRLRGPFQGLVQWAVQYLPADLAQTALG